MLRTCGIRESRGVNISALPESEVVDLVLGPLSNKARLQALKALYVETRTFSALSELTGLLGGRSVRSTRR